jgi:peptide-methionine (S)-S-oxide reductase
VLFTSEEQERVVRDFIREISGSFPTPIVTEVKELKVFYPAEEYHRKYYDRNPEAPYCRMVIAPKLGKLKKLFRQGDMGSSVDRFPG